MHLYGLLPLLVLLSHTCAIPNILSLMYRYGDKLAQEANDKIKKHDPDFKGNKQYLVVTMLSRNEAYTANDWTNLEHLIANKRLKFYLNEKQNKLDETGGKAKHGELIFLYMENDALGTLQSLIPRDTEGDGNAEDNRPLLIFFSYYIPCACVQTCNFHCAEELAHAAGAYKKRFQMVVGYADVYERSDDPALGTNREESMNFLTGGGVIIYKYITDHFDVEHIEPNTHVGKVDVFQVKLLKYLIKSPVSEYAAADKDRKKRITTAFINMATVKCFTEGNRPYFGVLTKLSREYLRQCLKKYVEHNINNKDNKMLIDHCVNDALEQSIQIGYPTLGGYDQYEPVGDQVRWNTVYEKSFLVYTKGQFFTVPSCIKQSYSIATYCTKAAKKAALTGQKLNELIENIMLEKMSSVHLSRSKSMSRPRSGSLERIGATASRLRKSSVNN